MSATLAGVRARTGWTAALAGLGLGTAALLALFHAEVAAAIGVWIASTAFGHCFLVAPIAAWLAWERRDRLAALRPRAWPAAAVLALPIAAVWLAAERLGIMEGRQFMLLAATWTLALAVLGPRVAWAAAVPLAYLVFLVPFGAFLVPALQDFTARFIEAGLGALDIPHVVTATSIEIPEGFFRVAEACAGLRFLIASVAFGALYACVIYRSPGRRIAFIAVATVVPVLANGVRALGIVVLGHLKGSAEAGAVDHVLYGWLFFSLVILLLLLLGLPFRQDARPAPLPVPGAGPAGSPRRVAWAVAAVLLLAGVGPAAAAWLRLRAAGEAVTLDQARFATPPGCAANQGGFVCAGVALEARMLEFGSHAGAGEILAAQHAATAEGLADDSEVSSLDAGGRRWQVVVVHEPDRVTAAGLWVDGEPAPSGLALRLKLAEASIRGATRPARLVTVSAAGRSDARVAVEMFLQGQPDLSK